MKNLDLTTWERTKMAGLIKSINMPNSEIRMSCNIGTLHCLLRVLDVLELSEEEKNLVGWIPRPNGQFVWTNAQHTFNLTFEHADYEQLHLIMTKFEGWSPSEGHLVKPMLKKLGIT